MHWENFLASVPGEKEPLPQPTKEDKAMTAFAVARRVWEISIHNLKKNNSYVVAIYILTSYICRAGFVQRCGNRTIEHVKTCLG